MRWAWLLGLAACGRLGFDGARIGTDGGNDAMGSDTGPARVVGIVQTANATAATGSMSVTVTLPTKPTPGNLVVVTGAAFQFDGLASLEDGSTIDSGSGSIPLVIHEVTTNGCLGRGDSVAIYAGLATSASSGVITVTPLPVMGDETSVMAAEYSGVSTVDDSSSAISPGTASPQAVRSGQADVTTVPELAVAVGTSCSGDPNPQMWTDTAGFDTPFIQDQLQANVPVISARKIVTTLGTIEDTWSVTYSSNTGTGFGAIATFR
jgi:hypothetical protein